MALPPLPIKLIRYQPLPMSSRMVTVFPSRMVAMASLPLPGPERTNRPLPAPVTVPVVPEEDDPAPPPARQKTTHYAVLSPAVAVIVTFTWEEPVFTLDTTPSGLTVAADSSLLLQVISASAGTTAAWMVADSPA